MTETGAEVSVGGLLFQRVAVTVISPDQRQNGFLPSFFVGLSTLGESRRGTVPSASFPYHTSPSTAHSLRTSLRAMRIDS